MFTVGLRCIHERKLLQYMCGWFVIDPSSNTLTFQSCGILPLHVPPERGPFFTIHGCKVAHPSPEIGQRHPFFPLGGFDFAKEHRLRPARNAPHKSSLEGAQPLFHQSSPHFSSRAPTPITL